MNKIPEKRIQAVVFDFDGTLAELTIDFDLMKKRLAALAEALLGERPEPGGLPALEWLDLLAERAGAKDRDLGLELHSRGRLVITAMELDAARQGRLFDFARPMLRDLEQRGVSTAVITRNCTPAVKAVFPDLDEYCPVLLARDDVADPKPHPGHLLAALKALDCAPAMALAVGDHPMDIKGARAAGTLSAGVASGRISLEELGRCAPDYLARDCAELVRHLETLGVFAPLGKVP